VLDEGVLIGGKGLPKDTTNIAMDGGKVVKPQMVKDIDAVLKLLEKTGDLDFDPTALAGDTLDQDLTKRTSQLERLRQMISDEKYEKRLAAVAMLARARELDNVPALIYALDDPAPQVAREARDGLRFISRKFFGFGLIIESVGELTGEARAKALKAQRSRAQVAQAKWAEWYLSIQPEGELIH
jgi:HEAT repeat protein